MGENAPLTELLPVLWREGRRRVLAMALIFAGIALAALIIGALWQKSYTSSTSILIQQSNIISPLMEGRAVATGAVNRASTLSGADLRDRLANLHYLRIRHP